MKIIKYTKKSANKYNILLENQESISLYSDLILKYNLLILKEIDNNTLEAIKKDNLNSFKSSGLLKKMVLNIMLI